MESGKVLVFMDDAKAADSIRFGNVEIYFTSGMKIAAGINKTKILASRLE